MFDQLPPILGEDPAFLDAVEHCSRMATIDRSCLVVGERGTGKELFTARLHYLSPRWNGPLIKINCAALSETLLESELFGHELGAFTGAQKKRAGRFELADSGTLVLDEIANASAAVQEKILRVIEYGEFERVGGTETIRVDVRVIGAANVDLPSLAKAGKFRADLLDRLAFDVITIPPMRSRPIDILPMAEFFALDVMRDMEMDAFPGFSDAARQTLLSHTWPGNVRELRNVVERSIFYAPSDGNQINDVAIDPFNSPWRPPASLEGSSEIFDIPPPSAPPSFGSVNFSDTVAEFETSLITKAMNETRHVQKDAANRLGLGYHQFRRLLKKLNIK
ncbi:MAG: phage shock protein operon transcriptional activator [Rhodospirillales bacterium]|jgi:psp operon transcriptional activator|nr:phage shock protein operon transcriptional activator [Rhodospirillales bacterium]